MGLATTFGHMMTRILAKRVARALILRGYAAITVGTFVATDACDETLAMTVVAERTRGYSEVK